jgi:hypothetical protein
VAASTALGLNLLPYRFGTSYWEGFDQMEWTTPQHEEVSLSCEVSSYANAEL